ncbi:MAG: guanylate kinase [Bacteroides sp.]|nr:guanylate kinase [Bacteroides sp.]MCM1085223.1 guanylate kinase [Bacteroides sp.]
MEHNGKLIIFSAPSGSGKTTIVHRLLSDFPQLKFSVSATSRAMRPGEQDGKDYHFLSVEEFKRYRDQDKFLEWEEVYANQFYGTLMSEVEKIWNAGGHVVFDVDVKGGLNIKRKFPERTLAVFVAPPSLQELENRLRKRGTETEESLKKRVGKAEEEMKSAPLFDRIVVNDDLQQAIDETRRLVEAFLAQEL